MHDARKQPWKPKQALDLLRDADQLCVAKGKQVLRFDLKKQALSPEELSRLLAGPTGNLRAPTFRVGRTVVVGFDETMCRQVLGISGTA